MNALTVSTRAGCRIIRDTRVNSNHVDTSAEDAAERARRHFVGCRRTKPSGKHSGKHRGLPRIARHGRMIDDRWQCDDERINPAQKRPYIVRNTISACAYNNMFHTRCE